MTCVKHRNRSNTREYGCVKLLVFNPYEIPFYFDNSSLKVLDKLIIVLEVLFPSFAEI